MALYCVVRLEDLGALGGDVHRLADLYAEQSVAFRAEVHVEHQAEVFGEDTALFRGVPSEWGLSKDLRTRLKNLLDRVIAQESTPGADTASSSDSSSSSAPSSSGPDLNMDESLFEALASEACHSAVRAGDRLETEEAASLIGQLFRCEHPWNCPHGRPTVVKVPRARFEEWFQRRV